MSSQRLFVCVKVKLSLDTLMETLLALSDTGDGAGRIEQLLKDLRSLQDRAQVRLTSCSPHSLTQLHSVLPSFMLWFPGNSQ